MKKTIGFIGAGRITRIILQALENYGMKAEKISAFDVNDGVTARLKEQFPAVQITTLDSVATSDLIFIALHPPMILETIGQLKGKFERNAIFISLAPKITLAKISETLETKNVVRLIPNATSLINQGYNPVCYNTDLSGKNIVEELLAILGRTFETEEIKLEAYAIASAMLPTYFWFQWYQLIDIARQMGLTEEESRDCVMQTLQASIDTMFNSGLNKEEVIDLIPVKPIGEHEATINGLFQNNLIALYNKIKP
ncbi:MAG: NAD(P)-binding domain-containing protein [Bacteroidales bacterium]